jgi:nicotinate-nucleotide adenylyltransferase
LAFKWDYMRCIFGGTFDPVHFGHLRPALDVQQALAIECVHLLPCRIPPHREMPGLSDQQRLSLLQLAIENESGLVIDTRELQREGPSYMVDTLLSLRAEIGDQPLCLALGMDALRGLDTWHRWEEILELCHLVIMQRPGNTWPRKGKVAQKVNYARVEALQELSACPAGRMLAVPVTQMAVSATQIRGLLSSGRSARYLLPEAVLERIMQEKWYAN